MALALLRQIGTQVSRRAILMDRCGTTTSEVFCAGCILSLRAVLIKKNQPLLSFSKSATLKERRAQH